MNMAAQQTQQQTFLGPSWTSTEPAPPQCWAGSFLACRGLLSGSTCRHRLFTGNPFSPPPGQQSMQACRASEALSEGTCSQPASPTSLTPTEGPCQSGQGQLQLHTRLSRSTPCSTPSKQAG